MPGRQSLRLVAARHHRWCPVHRPGFQSAAKAASRHARAPGVLISAAGGRRFMAQHPRCGHPLRFYIRPHFTKCGAVAALKLRLVPRTAARPRGFMKQALCKVASAPASCVHSSGFWPGALRSNVASGLRPSMGASPRPPSGASPLRGFGPRGLPVRPPRGLPQPAQTPRAGFARPWLGQGANHAVIAPRTALLRSPNEKKARYTGLLSCRNFRKVAVGKNVGRNKKSLETRMNTSYLAERAGFLVSL